MNDTEIKEYLQKNGYPEHLVKAGRKGLIAKYEKFVEEVEAGYSLTLDDYRNDLDLRAILLRLGLGKKVAEADKRFRKCLAFSGEPIWECDENPEAFWLFGYPKNAKGDLKKDLKAAGFL